MITKKVLMVEGTDDKHVVKHLCGTRNLGLIDHIVDYGGVDPLIEAIEVRLKESDVAVVGIIIDADVDLDARWQAVLDRLRRSGFQQVPDHLPSNGLVIRPPESTLLPKVGVWIMPNNKLPGILEDFLSFLIPKPDPLFKYLKNALDRLDPALVRFSAEKKPKALIHSWLAYQQEPGRPLGVAISARYLDAGVPEADNFSGWLRRLFFCELEAAGA